MARITVDIDSTLYDFETVARDAFFKIAQDRDDKNIFRGAYTPWVEWRSPPDACGLDVWLEAIDLAHTPEIILSQTPYLGAAETIEALRENGHSIMFLSNRSQDVHGATKEWLTDHDLMHGNSTLICTHGDKRNYMQTSQYLIDDRPKTLVEFVYDTDWKDAYPDELRKAFGIHHEYNRALTDVNNIYLAPTWGGLNHYLKDKGLLEDFAYKSLGVPVG